MSLTTQSKRTEIEEINIIKAFCDWRKFDSLDIIPFGDMMIIIPKEKSNSEKILKKYMKIYFKKEKGKDDFVPTSNASVKKDSTFAEIPQKVNIISNGDIKT